MNYEYLTDEELNSLIADVEQNDLVAAPPNILGSILEELPQNNASDKIVEFRRFRMRVIAAVAAVVAFVMIVPGITRNIPKAEDVKLIEFDINFLNKDDWSSRGTTHYINDFIKGL